MSNNVIPLRLSVKGREEIIKAMKDMGGEHARAAKKIEEGSKKANSALRGVNTAVNEGKRAMEDYAQQGGILGRIMKDMGPGGLAMGAAVGGITVALGAALKVAREAVTAFDEIGKSADTLQLTTDMLQGLKAAANDEGVAFTDVEGAVRSLTKAHSDLVLGSGELFNRLKDTNPELLEMLRNTTNNDERLRIITGSLQGATSATEKANIAYAAFGESGLGVARMLERQQGGVDAMIGKYREMGLIVREDVIRNAEDMQTQFGVASQVIDLQLKQAFIDLAPVLLESIGFLAEAAGWLGKIVERTREFSDRGTASLETRLEEIADRLVKLGVARGAIDEALASGEALDTTGMQKRLKWLLGEPTYIREFNEIVSELLIRGEQDRQRDIGNIRKRATTEQLQQERAALVDHLAQMTAIETEMRQSGEIRSVEQPFDRDGVNAAISAIDAELSSRANMPKARDLEAEAAAKAAAAARETEMNRLRTEAIALQKQLGDYTAYLANETARYQKLLDEGLITPAQYQAAVASLTDELDGTTKALELWKGMVEAARSPVENLEVEMDKLDADYAAGRIEIDLYRQAMDLLIGKMAEAKDAANEARPAFKEAQAVLAELQKAADDALTPAEKLRKEQERIDALVRSGDLDDDKASEWLALYKKRLDEASEATGFLAMKERLLDEVQSGRIKTLGDLRRVFGEMLIDMVRQYLAAQQKMQGGSFLDFMMGGGNGGGNPFSFGGWGGSGGEGGGGGFWKTALSVIGSFFGQSHSGGSAARPPQIRSPRSPLAGNERMLVVDDSQTILTASGRMNIASDIAAMASERAALSGLLARTLSTTAMPASASPKVTINNYSSAEVETSSREGPDGPEMTIDIKGEMRAMVRGGVLDGPMKERYGLRPGGVS